MPQSFACCYFHVNFSTKDRAPLITSAVRPRLFEYMGGILGSQGCALLAVGGMPDHVHLLASLDRQTSISKAMRLVKANSARWIHETFPNMPGFAWQTGYGAFSVSASHLEKVGAYLSRQAEHHRKVTFQEEFVTFLERHGVVYDEQYLWD
jgi:putative transposase